MLSALPQQGCNVVTLPIYDRHGQPVGWLQEDTVRQLDGDIVAFVCGEAVYDNTGACVGFIHNRYFRDLHGDAVAFLRGAAGGPPLPLPRRLPMCPAFSYAPMRPIGLRPPVQSKAPNWSVDWSPVSWKRFLAGNY
jgi:hypothetical protein